jgi:methylated-DNA-[protein]-cysteine S-methyltransferase
MNEAVYTFVDTELGTVYVCSTPKGICRLTIGDIEPAAFEKEIEKRFGALPQRDDSLAPVLRRDFRSYVRGARVAWMYDLDLHGVTEFQKRVLDAIGKIPYGTARSYGRIAKELEMSGRGAQAVGQAVGANPVPIIIPCHRVIGAEGIGGFGLGLELKKKLLAIEGVEIE